MLKSILQRLYPCGKCRVGKAVYLTFDDGPIPEVTPKVLAILDRYGVKATFFMVGENIDKHPDVFEQVIKAGHAIGNHTFPSLFRPPYGRTWLWQRMAVKRLGYEIYLWDVLTRDYNPRRTPEAMLKQIQRQTRSGSIINFHDSIKSNERMLAVLPLAIEWLLANGYELKTL